MVRSKRRMSLVQLIALISSLVCAAVIAGGCDNQAQDNPPTDLAADQAGPDQHLRTDAPDLVSDTPHRIAGVDVPDLASSNKDLDVQELDADVQQPPTDTDSTQADGEVKPDDDDGNLPGDLDVQPQDVEVSDGMDLDGSDLLDVADLSDGSDGETQEDVVEYSDLPCCFPASTPGCGNPDIEACVCAVDAFCCIKDANFPGAWDANCVFEVESLKCGTCQEEVVCGDGTCHPTEHCEECPQDCGACPAICGDGNCQVPETCSTCPKDCGVCSGSTCCKAQTTPGCDQPAVQQCVCADDTYCCLVSWDANCVNEIKSYKCGYCE